jgi:hypothetical protein
MYAEARTFIDEHPFEDAEEASQTEPEPERS